MAKFDRFQPPNAREQLYRCESCGELIEGGTTVFFDDIPYHLDCRPDIEFQDDHPAPDQDALRKRFWTWIGYTGISAAILVVAMFVRMRSESVKGFLVMGLLLITSGWFLSRVVRK